MGFRYHVFINTHRALGYPVFSAKRRGFTISANSSTGCEKTISSCKKCTLADSSAEEMALSRASASAARGMFMPGVSLLDGQRDCQASYISLIHTYEMSAASHKVRATVDTWCMCLHQGVYQPSNQRIARCMHKGYIRLQQSLAQVQEMFNMRRDAGASGSDNVA